MARILIIEDNRNLALGLRTNLEFEGHDAEIARDGTGGLMRARTGSHDLVVLDLMLPGLDGFRVLDALRAERITTPVLVLTARGDESDKVRGLRGGADDYVTKPFALRELLARVEALLRRARPAAGGPMPSASGIRFGDVAVNPATRVVTRGGRPVPAPPQGVRSARRAAPAGRRGRRTRRAAARGLGLPRERAEPDPRHPRRRAAPEARGRPRRAPTHPHGPEGRLPAGARRGLIFRSRQSARTTTVAGSAVSRAAGDTGEGPGPSGARDSRSRYYGGSLIIGE